MRNSGRHPISNYAHGRQRDGCFLRLRQRETYVLERQRQSEAWRVTFADDFFAIDSVCASTEHRISHNVDERLGIVAALADQSDDFGERLQCRRGQTNVRCPRTSRRGRQRSTSAGAPAAMMKSWRALAASGFPNTGAAT